jgi:hypothetical protein
MTPSRRSLAWLAAATVALTSGACAEPIAVLLIDGQNNHAWQETTPVLEQILESSGRFRVDVSTTPPKDAPPESWQAWRPDFSKYDAVLSNYNGQMWPDEVGASFLRFVRDGGAAVIVHAANNAFGLWPDYNELIGLGGWGGRTEKHGPYVYVKDGAVVRDTTPGPGGSHGPQREFLVEVFDAEHPITKGMPPKWLHAKDELYDSLRGPATNLQVLATALSEKTGKQEPMIFTVAYGKGRVFHTPMGHAAYSMKCVGFADTLRRGTEWAVTGAVTIPLSAGFPGPDAVVPLP